MKTKRHYFGAAIAALTVATFAGSAFADDSGSTGGSAVQEETSLATAPTGQSSDAATAQTEIAPDTTTSSEAASSENPAAETATGDSAGWTLTDSSSSDSANGSTTTTNEESTPAPPTETSNSDQGSNTTTTEGQPAENGTEGPATCPSHPVTGAHFSIGSTTATATFSIAPGCEGVLVMLASYTTPDPQKLFDGAGNTFSAGGPYTLTVNLPNCFFQIDVFVGQAPTVVNGPFAIVIGAVGRVGIPCVETPPTTTTTETTTTTKTTSSTGTTTTTPTTSTTTTTTPVTSTVEGTTTSGSTPGNVAGEESNNGGNTNVLGVAAKVAALPFTGFSLALLSVLGAFLLLLGVGLRLAARRGAKQ